MCFFAVFPFFVLSYFPLFGFFRDASSLLKKRRTASAFLHTPQGRRNHRPLRGECRHCPEDFDGDISAPLVSSFLSIHIFLVFVGIIRPLRAKNNCQTLPTRSGRQAAADGRAAGRGGCGAARRGAARCRDGGPSGQLRKDDLPEGFSLSRFHSALSFFFLLSFFVYAPEALFEDDR